jgi:hypothetical protein
VRAVPILCEFYTGICLTTEEKARKNHTQGKTNLSQVNINLSQNTVYILPRNQHIIKPTQTHTLQNPLTHTHTHTTWEFPERSRSAATVYSRTHLLCVVVCLLLLLTVVYNGISTALALQFCLFTVTVSTRDSVPRLLLHSPNKYPTTYRIDPIGRNSNLEFPIGRI